MTPREFENWLDRLGADLTQWPEDKRLDAQSLLDRSGEARAILRDAEALSSVLSEAPRGEVHSALTARIMATAPGSAHGSALAQSRKQAGEAPPGVWGGIIAILWPGFGWVRPAALMALSMMAGLYMGIASPSANTANQEADLFAYLFEVPNNWDTGDLQ